MQRRHLLLSATLVVGAAVAISYAVKLSAYGVPASLVVSCSLAVGSTALVFASRLADLFEVTTHRCQAPGCDFQARVRGVSAVENRRWQETAAEHPTHRYRA
ncbi:hypothetical protein CP981_11200 [Streptomyces platensis]|uniref:Uncharacterized protein n=1 Tax=Streptomyces platensis TaxID=58346 RepID=A0AAE6TP65_STRPT|nr:hypothetical protein [Streptomyces platensis]OSY35957.1 hypothetical protein BG653_06982 [Streptomyces platensis]QEV52158.1 hypothetical protein CP981_11200 [Streptomyces platensis]